MSQCWAKIVPTVHRAALLPIQSSCVMKKTTEIIARQYLIWPVWGNEVYSEEFARSGSPICIEIDSSRSADMIKSDLKPRNKVILMCFSLSFGLKTAQKRSNFQSSLISSDRDRECSEFRRTLRMAVDVNLNCGCAFISFTLQSLLQYWFYLRVQRVLVKLLCLLFQNQDLSFQCSHHAKVCGAEK